jgi:hypothetical protein
VRLKKWNKGIEKRRRKEEVEKSSIRKFLNAHRLLSLEIRDLLNLSGTDRYPSKWRPAKFGDFLCRDIKFCLKSVVGSRYIAAKTLCVGEGKA